MSREAACWGCFPVPVSERFAPTFPAGVPFLSTGPAPLENRLGYVSAR